MEAVFKPVMSVYPPTGARTAVRGQLTIQGGQGASSVPADVVVLLDVSYSMEGERLTGARQTLSGLWEAATADNRVGLVVFSGEDYQRVLVPLTRPADFEPYRSTVASVQPVSTTCVVPGIRLAAQQFIDHGRPNANKVIILMTDGAFDESTDTVVDAAKVAHEHGITFIIAAIGMAPEYKTLAAIQELDDQPMCEIWGLEDRADFQKMFRTIIGLLNEVWGRNLCLSFMLEEDEADGDVREVWVVTPRIQQMELSADGDRVVMTSTGPVSGNPTFFFYGDMEALDGEGELSFLVDLVMHWETDDGPQEASLGDVTIGFGEGGTPDMGVVNAQRLVGAKRNMQRAMILAAQGDQAGSLAMLDKAGLSLTEAGVAANDLLSDLAFQIQSGSIAAKTGGQSLRLADDAVGDLL